ncbi:MAG: molybdenum cofactor guanylyltransferase [Cypionkella sp.]
MSPPHAVIIAGGQGQRLGGVRKAELRIGGSRLVDRVASALHDAAQPILVATGHGRLPTGPYIGVADLTDDFGGPLAGLAAAVDWLAAEGISDGLFVSVAVDTPFLPPDFIAVMTEALGNEAAIAARWGEQFYPPNTLWRLAAIATLPARVRNGTAPNSPKGLLAELGAATHDWRPALTDNPFDNLNTLTDLVRLQRCAK